MWKGQSKHSVDGRSQSFDQFNRPSGGASGGGSRGHDNFSLGHKRNLPPHVQKTKDAWITAKQKLSSA